MKNLETTTKPPANETAMSADSFGAFLERMGYSYTEAAEALGTHRHTIRAYREGKSKIPRMAALACAAISYGLPPMR